MKHFIALIVLAFSLIFIGCEDNSSSSEKASDYGIFLDKCMIKAKSDLVACETAISEGWTICRELEHKDSKEIFCPEILEEDSLQVNTGTEIIIRNFEDYIDGDTFDKSVCLKNAVDYCNEQFRKQNK